MAADGTSAAANATGITISGGASGATIGGTTAADRNVISGNTGDGIDVLGTGTDGNVIQGNYIGLDASGIAALSNQGHGVQIAGDLTGTTIGGPAASARNVIGGNANFGIYVYQGANTLVQNNYLGTDVTGNAAAGSQLEGVRFDTTSGGNQVLGNVVGGNANFGIDFNNAAANVARGNTVGLGADGSTVVANGVGINMTTDGNTIGGTSPGDRNIVSGNTTYGISVIGTGNLIQGNYVGTDVSGSLDRGNSTGIIVQGVGTVIDANVISANAGNDLFILHSTGTKITGNLIGTNAVGTAAVGSTGQGVFIYGSDASGNTIGGTTTAERNVISGTGFGVRFEGGTHDNVVEGNYIGTDAAGTGAIANTQDGVAILSGSTANTIGGTSPAARNVISGNRFGIEIAGASGNVVEGNYVGTAATGTAALANAAGVVVSQAATSNTIGGTTAAARNVISGNSGIGVDFTGSGTTGNRVQGNYIGTAADGAGDPDQPERRTRRAGRQRQLHRHRWRRH